MNQTDQLLRRLYYPKLSLWVAVFFLTQSIHAQLMPYVDDISYDKTESYSIAFPTGTTFEDIHAYDMPSLEYKEMTYAIQKKLDSDGNPQTLQTLVSAENFYESWQNLSERWLFNQRGSTLFGAKGKGKSKSYYVKNQYEHTETSGILYNSIKEQVNKVGYLSSLVFPTRIGQYLDQTGTPYTTTPDGKVIVSHDGNYVVYQVTPNTNGSGKVGIVTTITYDGAGQGNSASTGGSTGTGSGTGVGNGTGTGTGTGTGNNTESGDGTSTGTGGNTGSGDGSGSGTGGNAGDGTGTGTGGTTPNPYPTIPDIQDPDVISVIVSVFDLEICGELFLTSTIETTKDVLFNGLCAKRISQTNYNNYQFDCTETASRSSEEDLDRKGNMKIAPNPLRSDILHIGLPLDMNGEHATIQLSTISGQVISRQEKVIQGNSIQLPVAHLLPQEGLYIISIQSSKYTDSQKFFYLNY